MKSISRKKTNENVTVSWTFTLDQIDMYWKYVMSVFVSMSELNKLKKFFDTLDMDVFKYNSALYARVLLIKTYLVAIVDHGLSDKTVIETFMKDHDEDGLIAELLPSLDWSKNQLDNAEVRMISKSTAEKLQCIWQWLLNRRLIQLIARLQNLDFIPLVIR